MPMLSRMDSTWFTKPDTAPMFIHEVFSSPSLRGSQSSARTALLQHGVRLTLCVAKELKSSSPNTATTSRMYFGFASAVCPRAVITIIATQDERILQLLKFCHNPDHDSVLSHVRSANELSNSAQATNHQQRGETCPHPSRCFCNRLGPPGVEDCMPSQASVLCQSCFFWRLANTSRSMSACRSALCTSIAIALYPLSW